MPRDPDEIDTDFILALQRKAELYQPTSQGDSVDRFGEMMTKIDAIRETQMEIKIELAEGKGRFKAIEEWQSRHEDDHKETSTDLKAMILPALGQIVWLAIAGLIGWAVAHMKAGS